MQHCVYNLIIFMVLNKVHFVKIKKIIVYDFYIIYFKMYEMYEDVLLIDKLIELYTQYM